MIPWANPFSAPFLGALDHVKVQQLLENSGLDRFGRIRLQLPDGTQTLLPVVVGFQHIVRLKHVPELKSQARRGGEGAVYSRNTGQAIHGRILGGGHRIGEMEVWALAGRLLASHLNGKDWLIRHESLGRRVDRSARLVIIPNPHLRWAEAGVPTGVLLELLGDELKGGGPK